MGRVGPAVSNRSISDRSAAFCEMRASASSLAELMADGWSKRRGDQRRKSDDDGKILGRYDTTTPNSPTLVVDNCAYRPTIIVTGFRSSTQSPRWAPFSHPRPAP